MLGFIERLVYKLLNPKIRIWQNLSNFTEVRGDAGQKGCLLPSSGISCDSPVPVAIETVAAKCLRPRCQWQVTPRCSQPCSVKHLWVIMAEKDGANKLDCVSVLSREQQETLRRFKIKTRIANESYLLSHPEVDVMVGDFVRKVLLKRPTDIREFAADYFTNPNLHTTLVSKMKESGDTA